MARTPITTTPASIIDDVLAETAKQPNHVHAPSDSFSVTDPNALNEFAKVAHERLTQMVEHGRTRAASVVERVMREVPTDYVRPAPTLRFDARRPAGAKDDAPRTELVMETIAAAGSDARMGLTLHRNALGQLASIAEVPMAYVSTLQSKGEWGSQLLASVLDETMRHHSSRHLIRAVDGQARGILSDKYRRLDSRPILEAFVAACQSCGAEPFDGHALDTKMSIKAVVPRVYMPVPNELMVFGVDFENSDYGNGALSLQVYMERLVCKNGMIRPANLRKIHIGGRLSDDVAFSQRTHDLDSQATASAIRDVVRNYLSPEAIERQLATVKAAHDKGIDPKAAIEGLKAKLTKGEVAAVKEAFTSADIVNMPAGQSAWRLSNAISWVANKTEDEERRIELQKVAGTLLPEVA